MGALSAAKHSVRIWTPYFVPDQPMIAALSTAALRGVRIDVLTPANGDHPTVQWAARAHYWQVLEHGVRIFERPGPFDHNKLMLVDGAWCCLGSANWDARSLRLNFEFNVEVYDTALSTRLSSLLMPLVMRRARYRRRRCAPTRWPSACATGWPVCSPHSLATRLARNIAHGKKDQWNIGYWIVAGLLLLTLQNYWQAAKTVEPVPYSEFEKALAEGRVAEVLVADRTVTGRLKSPDSRGKTTIVATRVEPDLAERLSKYDVPYARVVESTWLRDVLLDSAGGGLLRRLVLPVPPLRREAGHGRFLSIGKSRAKVFMEKNTGVTFADVAGVDEAKAELVEIVDFLRIRRSMDGSGRAFPRACCWSATGHRQDIAGQGCCRRGGGALLLHLRIRVCRDVRRRGCSARARPVRRPAGERRPSSSSMSSMRWAARGVGGPIGGHDERERPSTSCSRRWTASTARSG